MPTTKPATPLAAAEADQEAARADIERITAALRELRGRGPGADPVLLATLQSELEDALKLLRHADLAVGELTKAESAPLSAKTVEKIRRQRRKVHDLHPSLLARMSEHRRLRERKHALENQIAAAKSSGAFRQEQKDLKSRFVYGPGDQDRPEPPTNRPTRPSIEALARLERDLAVTVSELEIAVSVQASAQAAWEGEKRTLDAWEAAIRDHSAAARLALARIPKPGAADDISSPGWPDVAVGPNQIARPPAAA